MDFLVKLQLNWTIEWKYWKNFSFVFSLFCLQKILWNLNWVRYTQFYFRLESGHFILSLSGKSFFQKKKIFLQIHEDIELQ